MVSLEQIEPMHRWVAHEFDWLAREKFNWCIKGIGVQDLFNDRVGALRIIGQWFDPVTLHLRSLPDRCLYGDHGKFKLVEIKALEKRPNVAVETYQLCYLRVLQLFLNLETLYVFGEPDEKSELQSWVCQVEELPVENWYETRRFKQVWPNEQQKALLKLKEWFYPNVPVIPTDPIGGSGDPFVTFSRKSLYQKSKPLLQWLDEQGKQLVSDGDRKSWEGTKDKLPWKRYSPPRPQM